MGLSAASTERLAALHRARDRALAAPLDRTALDAFLRAVADLDAAVAVDPELSAEARHQAGRLSRGRYGRLARELAAGRTGYRLTREDPTAAAAAVGGPPLLVLPDGGGFDAAGLVRRLAGDWDEVARRA